MQKFRNSFTNIAQLIEISILQFCGELKVLGEALFSLVAHLMKYIQLASESQRKGYKLISQSDMFFLCRTCYVECFVVGHGSVK